MALVPVVIASIPSKVRLCIVVLMLEMIRSPKVVIHSWLQILGLEYL